jgi:septum formation protein
MAEVASRSSVTPWARLWPLVLASASPRRRDILEQLGLRFRVIESAVDEPAHADEAPAAYARTLACWKAQAVAEKLSANENDRIEHAGAFVLGADTIVVVDDLVLGKPTDDAHAREMIGRLAGRWHEVITAVALRRVVGAGVTPVACEIAVHTRVAFRALSPEDIRRYVATGEGRDKAGSYAIQGVGTGIVRAIEGSHSNVIGLPASETLDLLQQAGALESWP